MAAAAGVILSPFTLGASLALTAVGVGVATAGGITGASAAIANKVTRHETNFTDVKSLPVGWMLFGGFSFLAFYFFLLFCFVTFLFLNVTSCILLYTLNVAVCMSE